MFHVLWSPTVSNSLEVNTLQRKVWNGGEQRAKRLGNGNFSRGVINYLRGRRQLHIGVGEVKVDSRGGIMKLSWRAYKRERMDDTIAREEIVVYG